jgi:UDP-2,4-diacetamido-2,4,6-trideoxy-beta-L-altropyranose hydrolase
MISTKNRIVFRADGDGNIGLGHIMRCLSLANILKNSFTCLFITRTSSDRIKSLISEECELISISSSISIFEESNIMKSVLIRSDILVLDGYHFDERYQIESKLLVSKLVFIDDLANFHYYADLVINHGSSLIENKYKKEIYTRLLLGFPYLLLREPILRASQQMRKLNNPGSIFICMGGADPLKLTAKVFEAALACDHINKVIVVTGAAYGEMESLFALSKKTNKEVQIKSDIYVDELVKLIKNCDIAIAPASSISLELCCVKTALITGISADNQIFVLDQLLVAGCAVSIGDFRSVSVDELIFSINNLRDDEEKNKLLVQQSKVIDGKSSTRLKNEFRALVNAVV